MARDPNGPRLCHGASDSSGPGPRAGPYRHAAASHAGPWQPGKVWSHWHTGNLNFPSGSERAIMIEYTAGDHRIIARGQNQMLRPRSAGTRADIEFETLLHDVLSDLKEYILPSRAPSGAARANSRPESTGSSQDEAGSMPLSIGHRHARPPDLGPASWTPSQGKGDSNISNKLGLCRGPTPSESAATNSDSGPAGGALRVRQQASKPGRGRRLVAAGAPALLGRA